MVLRYVLMASLLARGRVQSPWLRFDAHPCEASAQPFRSRPWRAWNLRNTYPNTTTPVEVHNASAHGRRLHAWLNMRTFCRRSFRLRALNPQWPTRRTKKHSSRLVREHAHENATRMHIYVGYGNGWRSFVRMICD